MKYLAIKDYWKHQHYHKRGAPWIKLYAGILSDAAFIQLPEIAQCHLMKLWVLASQLGHPLPNNPRLLAGKIGTTGKFHLASIIAAGFVVECDTEDEAALVSGYKDASISLAESPQNATSTVRARARSRESREIEIEKISTATTATAAESETEAAIAVMLETDADRNALTVVVARARDRFACLTALSSMLTGNDPATPQPSPRAFGQALRDMAANGAAPTAKLFRRYIESAVQEVERPPPTPRATQDGRRGAAPGIGARAYATTLGAIEDL